MRGLAFVQSPRNGSGWLREHPHGLPYKTGGCLERKVLLSTLPMATGLAGKLGEEYKSALTHPPTFAILGRIAAVVALTLFLFAAVLADMAHDWWTEPSLSQGMLLPPLAFYFAWIHRHRTFSYAATADYRGILLTASACLMFLMGKLASEFFLMRFSFVVLLAGLLWTFWGSPACEHSPFPCCCWQPWCPYRSCYIIPWPPLYNC